MAAKANTASFCHSCSDHPLVSLYLRTWHGLKEFEFHGGCDLVLMKSKLWDIDIHVRTTIRYDYCKSFVSSETISMLYLALLHVVVSIQTSIYSPLLSIFFCQLIFLRPPFASARMSLRLEAGESTCGTISTESNLTVATP